MTPLFPARRAAEEFAGVLDGSRTDVADRYSSLTDTVTLLREQPAATPRADFVADLRERLMIAADDVLVEVPRQSRAHGEGKVLTLPTRSRTGHRIGKAAASAVAVAAASTGVAVASQSALPGDSLYPVKRGLESAQSRLAVSDSGRGASLLEQASHRISEVDALAERESSAADIEATLAAFEDSAGEGAQLLFESFLAEGDTADITAVRTFAAASLDTLTHASDNAPEGSGEAFASAARMVAEIDAQARNLCSGCGGDALDSRGFAASGPALAALVAKPALQAQEEAEIRDQQAALAAEAESLSGDIPVEDPTPDAPLAPNTGGEVSTPSAPTVGGDLNTDAGVVKSGVEQTTDAVTGLLDTLTTATGGATAPLTDTLDEAVEDVADGLGSVAGLLP